LSEIIQVEGPDVVILGATITVLDAKSAPTKLNELRLVNNTWALRIISHDSNAFIPENISTF
jgi:hypothetical protein